MTDSITLLLYPSLRGRAYIQNLVRNNVHLSNVILMDNGNSELTYSNCNKYDFFKPSEKEITTLSNNGINYVSVEANNCNDNKVIKILRNVKSDWVIYSGGGILRDEILSLNCNFIHIHPGSLPEYRGSTCFYYSLLNEGKCSCTAFIMEKGIDSGKIIHSKDFMPPKGIDFDNIYDNWMRSQTLIESLNMIRSNNFNFKNNNIDTDMYYIIHPVLKHISIMRHNDEI